MLRRTALAVIGCLALATSADNPLESKFGKPQYDPVPPAKRPATTTTAATQPAIDPAVRRALTYLGHNQHDTGGWGHFTVFAPTRQTKLFHPRPPNALPLVTQDVHYPANLAETAAVAAAFLEAGVSPAGPDGYPLRHAFDALCALSKDPAPDADRGLVERCQVTRAMLKPDVDQALALDALLAYRARFAPGAADRILADQECAAAVERLKDHQLDDGTWPIDFKVDNILHLNADEREKLVKAGRPIERYFLTFPQPKFELADAYILRTLHTASRAGVAVDPGVLNRAANALLAYYDPATGKTGGPTDGPQSFYRSVAALNLLYQLERSAPPAERDARRAALVRAHEAFFARLRQANDTTAPDPAALPPRNPLDAQPAAHEVRIRVPVSSVDVFAYFLLIESLQDSTHPDAHKVATGISSALARKLSDTGWPDPNRDDALTIHWALHGGIDTDNPWPRASNHLVTALATRTLLLPAPPAPPEKK